MSLFPPFLFSVSSLVSWAYAIWLSSVAGAGIFWLFVAWGDSLASMALSLSVVVLSAASVAWGDSLASIALSLSVVVLSAASSAIPSSSGLLFRLSFVGMGISWVSPQRGGFLVWMASFASAVAASTDSQVAHTFSEISWKTVELLQSIAHWMSHDHAAFISS